MMQSVDGRNYLSEGNVGVYKKPKNRSKHYPKLKNRDYRFPSKPKTAYKTVKTEDLTAQFSQNPCSDFKPAANVGDMFEHAH